MLKPGGNTCFQTPLRYPVNLNLPVRAAFADREKNRKSLVSGGGSGGRAGVVAVADSKMVSADSKMVSADSKMVLADSKMVSAD